MIHYNDEEGKVLLLCDVSNKLINVTGTDSLGILEVVPVSLLAKKHPT